MASKVKSKSKSKQSKPAAKLTPINVKVSAGELALFKKKAKKHTEGNYSAWLRLAGREYTPPAKVAPKAS